MAGGCCKGEKGFFLFLVMSGSRFYYSSLPYSRRMCTPSSCCAGSSCLFRAALTLFCVSLTVTPLPAAAGTFMNTMNTQVAKAQDVTLRAGDSTVYSGGITVLNVGDYHIGENETIDGSSTLGSHSDGGDGNASDTNGSRSGHETNRLGAQARFVLGDNGEGAAGGGFGGGDLSGPFTAEEKQKICSMQKAQVFGGDDLVQWLGELIAKLLNRLDAGPIVTALRDTVFCAPPQAAVVPKTEPLAVRFNKSGIILSSNPVWNRCAAGGYISAGLIKSNTDVSMHRQGSIEVYRPLTCSNYHTNSENVWRHPDFADLFVTLDGKGHLVGKLPSGYVAVQSQNADIADGEASTVAGK